MTPASRESIFHRMLDEVFGAGTSDLPVQRARESNRRFVRGLDLLTFDESARATGRRLTAFEAYDAYGMTKLREVARDGSAIISDAPGAAGNVLRSRREALGLELRTVANKSSLPVAIVEALERSSRRPIREYERVARVLGLDERLLSFRPVPEGNERVAVRLRLLADEGVSLSPSAVASLAEAAWVAMTQLRLEEALGLLRPPDFAKSDDYGGWGRPAFAVGYELADEVRDALALGVDPIPSMRDLVERQLGLPVIQVDLDGPIAGATVQVGDRRAIVVSLRGLNANPLVRRSTLAHEVAHVLFDPTQNLEDLRVDEYEEIQGRPDERPDPVEQRANAFAVQLLAPQHEAVRRYKEHGDLYGSVLDHFGISFTAGRFQVWNGMARSVPIDSIHAANHPPEPDWEGREAFTLTYHPIRELAGKPARAGRFSAIALRAASVGVVSWDTVAEWLGCSEDTAMGALTEMAGLFREVFEPQR